MESERREEDGRDTRRRERYPGLKRERSLQDIDKDIETIWKELQELDQIPLSTTSPSSSTPVTLLSSLPLVSPSWRRPSATAPTQHYSFAPRSQETRG